MFTGRRFDIETGLYYYRARYYNPHIGRFMQTDPVGYNVGTNLYAYCGNNPLGRVDPFGLASISVDIPTDIIIDRPKAAFAKRAIMHWLRDVGFFDEYKDWSVEDVSLNGAFFEVDLAGPGDMCDVDVKVPEFRIAHVGSAQVVVIDDIGRLDSHDRTLKMIWTRGSQIAWLGTDGIGVLVPGLRI